MKGAAVMAAALSLASGAVAQEYRVEFLHPMEGRWLWSTGRGISGGQMVGELHPVSHRGNGHAVVWNGDRNSWVDLHPKGAVNSMAFGAGGGLQVGTVLPESGPRYAALWRGSRDSILSLHVNGFDGTVAYATDGVYQVGTASTIQTTQAYVWQGSAESARNITPPGATSARAFDIHEGMIVGSASFGREDGRAMMWDASTGDAIDLRPPGFGISSARGIFGNQQVGFVLDPDNSYQRAGLWRGTGDSFVNLHPYGSIYTRTWAHATNGDIQVGESWISQPAETFFHAVAWRGTPESMFDLHDYLPREFLWSAAYDIDEFGNIIGYAQSRHDTFAVVWRPVPEPGTFVALAGALGAAFLKRRLRSKAITRRK
ncbi:MAG: PEP-CTERM sorting domain-containing protein [Armatimonadota bacterium]